MLGFRDALGVGGDALLVPVALAFQLVVVVHGVVDGALNLAERAERNRGGEADGVEGEPTPPTLVARDSELARGGIDPSIARVFSSPVKARDSKVRHTVFEYETKLLSQ